MKNILRRLTVSFGFVVLLAGCNNSPQAKEGQLDDAKENVVLAEEALIQSKRDSLDDFNTFKASMDLKLIENQRLIDNQKEIIKYSKKANKKELEKRLVTLEEKNKSLHKKIYAYEQGSAEKWELFKVEFNNEMKDLGIYISEMADENLKN